MAESDPGGGGYVQLPADCVTMCAESLGITQLAQDVVPALAEDVNYRVREATQNAIQFMRHAKRRKLMTDDFDKALYWSNVEPLYGFGGEPPVFNSIHESGLYSVEDKEVNMREMAFADSLDELNAATSAPQLSARWISIENHSISNEKGGQQIVIRSKCDESHQLYLSLLMDAIQGTSDEFRRVALAEIRNNSSAVDVAPDLVNIVTQTVEQRLHFNGSHVCRALRVLLAMLNNTLLYLGPFAPILVQLLTKMVLEPHPSWPPANERISHAQLSQLASVCIAELIRKYADGVNKLRSALHDTLAMVLTQPDPHLVILTGAVQIISFLGPQSIFEVLLDHMEHLVELVHTSSESSDASTRNIALKLYNGLLDSAVVLLINEEDTIHEGRTDQTSTVNYDHMCDLFGEGLLMALEAHANRITNNTTVKKSGKESSEISSFGLPAATPVGGEVKSVERYQVGGFNRTARRVPVTKPFGRIFFPVYRKSTPAAVNVLDCSIKRHKSLDVNRTVVQKGKLKTKNSAVKMTSLPLGSLTL